MTSRISIGFNQPLLAGFGRAPNTRFMVVARNDVGTAQEVFRQQVITSVAQLEDAYYNLAAFQLNVQVAQESLAAVQELLEQTRKEEEIGVLSRLDVVTVESQAAASERDLIVAQTNLEQQETTLKQLISKRNDPDLDAATIVLTDPLPEPREADLPEPCGGAGHGHREPPRAEGSAEQPGKSKHRDQVRAEQSAAQPCRVRIAGRLRLAREHP